MYLESELYGLKLFSEKKTTNIDHVYKYTTLKGYADPEHIGLYSFLFVISRYLQVTAHAETVAFWLQSRFHRCDVQSLLRWWSGSMR